MINQASAPSMGYFHTALRAILLLAATLLITACGGGGSNSNGTGTGTTATYTIVGSLSGLASGELVLTNGNDSLTIPANSTTFTLPTQVAVNTPYNITLSHEPVGYTCIVTNGSGTMPANTVTNLQINCNNTGSDSTNTPTVLLTADAGPLCEQLESGQGFKGFKGFNCDASSFLSVPTLDGSGSTSSNSTAPSFAWSFVFKPSGSTATLADANTSAPSFVPDVPGPYAVQLVVSADGFSSQRAVTQVINLTTRPSPYYSHGGLSGQCDTCHAVGGIGFRVKTESHIPTSNTCQTCHWSIGFEQVAFVDHKEVFGSCAVCHDGNTATGPSAFHVRIEPGQDCSDCHTTDGFLTLDANGKFDHSTISSPCSACHNGTTAIGTDSDPNPSGHPSISVECNYCHTTLTFAGAYPDHSAVTPGSCGQTSCHDNSSGNTSKLSDPPFDGINRTHPLTGNIVEACDLCHTTNTFATFDLGGEFDHGVLARYPIDCQSCHDGQNAKGKDFITNHPNTLSDCSACHNTTSFVIVGGVCSTSTDPNVFGNCFDHASLEVGGLNEGLACTTCHGGSATDDVRGAPAANDGVSSAALVLIHTDAAGQPCETCHMAGGSFSLATVDHSGFGSLGPNNPTDCISCHDGTTATGKNDGHIDTIQQCSVCHDPQSDTFAGAGFDHSSLTITGNISSPTCESCHDGSTAIGASATHVPVPSAGDHDCLVCHGTAFNSFSYYDNNATPKTWAMAFDHNKAVIANGNAPLTCSSCHDGKAHDGVIVISKPSGHIPSSADCGLCHDNTNNGPGINGTSASGFTTADPFVNTVHDSYNSGCRTCHNGAHVNAPYLATFYSSPASSTHATANSNGWDCNACHTTTGGFAETNPVNHQDPAVKAETCISCHDGNTTGATPKNSGHPDTSDDCQFCHQAGGSFVAGFDHTTLDSGGINQGLACVTCHNGVNATGKSDVPAGTTHVPTARDCGACHTGYPPAVPTFAGIKFDHSGPEMNGKQCMDCHNNTIALGKSDTHLPTSLDCGACHTTEGEFATNATGGFNHTGIVDGCQASGCHAAGTTGISDVTDYPGPRPHIRVTDNSGNEINCYGCHKNAGGTFANATMDHGVVTFAACDDCHDGQHDTTAKSNSHMVTSVASCNACHMSTTSWSVGARDYSHSTGDYPGDHSTRRISRCSQCHTGNNEDISTFPKSPYGTTCAACHASDGTREHGNPLPSRFYDCGSSGCHRVSSSSF